MLLPPAVARILDAGDAPLLWTKPPLPVRLRPLKPNLARAETKSADGKEDKGEVGEVGRRRMKDEKMEEGPVMLRKPRPPPQPKPGSHAPRKTPSPHFIVTPPNSTSPGELGLGMFWREPGQAHGLIFLESPARQPSAQDGKRKPGDLGSSLYGSGWRQQIPRAEPATNIALKAYAPAPANPPAPSTAPASHKAHEARPPQPVVPDNQAVPDNPAVPDSPASSEADIEPVKRGSSLHDTFMDVLDQELRSVGLPLQLHKSISMAVDRSLKELLDVQQKELNERLHAKLKKDLESEQIFWSHASAARKALFDEACRQVQDAEARFWSHASAVRAGQVQESEERFWSHANAAREALLDQARQEASQVLQQAAGDGSLAKVLDQVAAYQLPATHCYDNDLLHAKPADDVVDDMMKEVVSCSVSWLESLLDEAQHEYREVEISMVPKSEQERSEQVDEAMQKVAASLLEAAKNCSVPVTSEDARSPSGTEKSVLSASSCTPSYDVSEVASVAVHDVVDMAASHFASDVDTAFREDAAQSVAVSQGSEELWEDVALEVAKQVISSHLSEVGT
ncbi:unnamed protein product [Durusdinium trenchii]|uniref:Uncharacterized protein n=2 Tax=Durusdinium trenchii TaxID=1381693 RepID=A0ABP0RWN3_9DINO